MLGSSLFLRLFHVLVDHDDIGSGDVVFLFFNVYPLFPSYHSHDEISMQILRRSLPEHWESLGYEVYGRLRWDDPLSYDGVICCLSSLSFLIDDLPYSFSHEIR